MSDNVVLKTFPSSLDEALAFVWLRSQNLSDLSPEEMFDKYQEAYKRIHKHHMNGQGKQTMSF